MTERVFRGVADYSRNLLFTVLVYHQRRDVGSCACGWGVLGESHADHVLDVYEECWRLSHGELGERTEDQ